MPAAPKTQPARRGRRLRRIAQVLLVFALLDFALGWVLAPRLCHAFPREAVYLQRDEDLGFAPVPGSGIRSDAAEFPGGAFILRRNGQGLRRDDDVAVPKPPGTWRAVVVGDSHTDGMAENADTYPSQLEPLLAAQRQQPVEVLNAGVGRYSPYQCYRLLERDLLRFEPDLVVVALYVGNDVLDMLRWDDRPYLELVGDVVEARPPRFVVFAQGPLDFWRQRSLTYRVLREALEFTVERCLLHIELVRSLGGGLSDGLRLLWQLQRCGDRPLISQSLAQTAYFARYPQSEERALRLLARVIELHAALAQRNGYQLSFLLIPSRVEVEGVAALARQHKGLAALDLDPSLAGTDDRLCDHLADMLRQAGQSVVDPRAALRAAAGTGVKLYWDSDDHIDLDACRIIAQELARSLAQAGY